MVLSTAVCEMRLGRWPVGCPGKDCLNFLVYFCVFVEGEGLWYNLLPYARCLR